MAKHYEKSTLSSNYTRHLISGNVTGNLGINSAVRFSSIYGEGVDRLQVLKTLQKENTFRFWWYLIFSIATIVAFAFNPSAWLSVIEVFILMVNIDLVARGKVIGIYIGILDCIIYMIICYMAGLWGEILKMAIINIPLNIVAIVSWTKNIKKQSAVNSSLEIRRLNLKSTLIWIAVFCGSAVGGYFLLGALGTTSLIISSVSFAIGVISKILNGQRYMESYQVSMVGNIISLALWISTLIVAPNADATVQIILYLATLTNNIYSYALWRGMYRKRTVNGGKILARRKVKINRVIKLRRMYKNLYWDKKVDILKNS